MNSRMDIGLGRFFYTVGKRIICIPVTGYVTLRGQFCGGVEYWRGQVSGGAGVGLEGFAGVYAKQSGGGYRGLFAQMLAGKRGIEGLAGDAKRGGGFGGAGVVSDKGGDNSVSHGSVSKARWRVMVFAQSPDGQMKIALIRQRLGDDKTRGQLVLTIPRAGG